MRAINYRTIRSYSNFSTIVKRTLLGLTAALFATSYAFGEACEQTEMMRLTEASEIVTKGASVMTFRVLGQDFIDPKKWRSGDVILVCPDPKNENFFDLINLNKGERLVTFRGPGK